jgi:cell filamentation protein
LSRYRVSGSEGQYEKNPDEHVLANKLGIANPGEMDEAELVLLEKFYPCIVEEQFPTGQVTIALLWSWHRRWPGNIYEWAG